MFVKGHLIFAPISILICSILDCYLCASYLRYPFKKSKRHGPKLSASPLALPSQRDACAIKLRADKPLLNEHASRCLDNQVEGCWVLFVCGKKTQQRIHKHIISLRQPSSYLRSSFLH